MSLMKGQKLLHAMIHNWLDETGEIPTHQELITHLFSMENEEFDSYLNQQDYFFRKEMHVEGERQAKLIEESSKKVSRKDNNKK